MTTAGKVSRLYSTPKRCNTLLYNLLPQPDIVSHVCTWWFGWLEFVFSVAFAAACSLLVLDVYTYAYMYDDVLFALLCITLCVRRKG